MSKTWIFFIGLFAGVALFLIFSRGCNDVQDVQPKIIPVEKIVTNIVRDEAYTKHIVDSLMAINSKVEKNYQSAQQTIDNLKSENNQLAVERDEAISHVENQQVKNDLISSALKMDANNKAKDSACSQAINALKTQVRLRSLVVVEKDKLLNKQRLNIDTLVSNQNALEKYISKIKPRNQLLIGITTNVYPVFGYGIASQLRLKSGVTIGGAAMVMNKQMNYQATILKPISFR